MPLALRIALPIGAVLIVVAAVGAIVFAVAPAGTFSFTGIVADIQSVQRNLHQQLATAMRLIQEEGIAAAWTLTGLSFFYGVFHAAGPGHGKVVISTYLLTQESQLRRGVVLAVLSSFVQGITAIVAVTATVAVMRMTLRQAQGATANLEIVSYGLVALVGLMLLVSRFRRIRNRHRHGRKSEHKHDHDGLDSHSHCGHAHGPSRADLDVPLSLAGMAAIVFSIGIRPCSGGILTLLVAFSLGLPWAGVAAVMAMALGTAITVSAVATLSVYSRKGALHLMRFLPDRAGLVSVIVDGVAMLGGVVILLAGLLLLYATWTAPLHPLR
ncbi:MAG: nickel/cobalt transporter [Alphaproteobacteria bacterium]